MGGDWSLLKLPLELIIATLRGGSGAFSVGGVPNPSACCFFIKFFFHVFFCVACHPLINIFRDLSPVWTKLIRLGEGESERIFFSCCLLQSACSLFWRKENLFFSFVEGDRKCFRSIRKNFPKETIFNFQFNISINICFFSFPSVVYFCSSPSYVSLVPFWHGWEKAISVHATICQANCAFARFRGVFIRHKDKVTTSVRQSHHLCLV